MKKLTRGRVVPIISASVSWLTFAITVSGSPVLPKIREQKQSPRQALLAGVEEMVDKVFFHPDRAGQQVGDELVGEGRIVMKRAKDDPLLDAHHLAVRERGRSGDAPLLPREAAFAAEFVFFQDCDHGFLAVPGQDADFDLALVNIEDAIRGVALHEERLILVVFDDNSPLAVFDEEILWINHCAWAGQVCRTLSTSVANERLRTIPQFPP